MRKTIIRTLLIVAGSFSVGIGILGIFIPILPTTPFLLLAAVCYMKSSDRLHQWLLNNRIFGAYVKDYIEGRGMPVRVKIFTILLLWITIILSVTLGIQHIALRIALILIAIGVTLHISLIKTKKVKSN